MSLLLDSHTLLWWLNDDPRLSAAARAAIRPKIVPVWVSAVTGYELRLNQRLGKLHGVPDDLAATLDRQGFAPLPVSLAHAGLAAALPLVHRDPWDRLLIAQARLEGLSLVSADPVFAAYGVEVVS